MGADRKLIMIILLRVMRYFQCSTIMVNGFEYQATNNNANNAAKNVACLATGTS